MKLAGFAADAAQQVREVVRGYVREHGYKRGLHLFARAVGCTERRARAIHSDEPGVKLDAAEYLAALEARGALNRHRTARLRLELEQLERQEAVDGAGDARGEGDVLAERPGGGCGRCPRAPLPAPA